MKSNKTLTLIAGLLFILPISSHAIGALQLSVIGDIKPHNNVIVRLISPYKDVGGTNVLWLENNEIVEEGLGMVTHRVDLGEVGDSVIVTAILGIPGSNGKERVSMNISPAILDVLWEAQTAVPPFYKGKALPSHESLIKTFAIPEFGTTTPNSIVNYSWKKNKTISIGDGLNIISAGLFGTWENSSTDVSATAIYKSLTANKDIKIPSFKPYALFYEISPTQGILTQDTMQSNPTRNSVELSLLAVPFGFANAERNKSQVLYEWTAGKKRIKEGRGSAFEAISLSRSNSPITSGEIVISLLAQNVVNVMQYSENKISWRFTQK